MQGEHRRADFGVLRLGGIADAVGVALFCGAAATPP